VAAVNAAVTGGTGFLGRVLLRGLAQQAGEIRALARRAEDEPALMALGALPIRGDLTLPGGCAELVRRDDVVFHAAARVDMTGPWSEFSRTTVTGTRRLLEAALPCRPSRFVYVSSAGVYLGARGHGAASADRTLPNPLSCNLYARAKLEAEDLVRGECERAGCPWTIVRLGFLYGPGNRALLRHLVPLLERGRLYIVGSGRNRIATLYVDDAAHAVLLAGMHPAAEDKIYDVANDEHVTQREYLEASADALGLARPRRRVGRRVAYVVAGLAELWARLRGGVPPFTRAMVVLMAADQVLDTSRIRAELGWRPEVAFEEGMRRTAQWHRQLRAGHQ
jgi:nucleoside-diphosphate-sugar epimerase